MSNEGISLVERRERLERRADVTRSRLVRAIDALDHRRRQVTELGHEAERLAAPVAISVAGVALIAVSAAVVLRTVTVRRRERSIGWQLAHFVESVRGKKRRSFFAEAARTAVLAMLGVLAADVAKRGSRRLLGPAEPVSVD